MKIPLNAKVECTDGICGRFEYVLINPVVDQVTYLVVEEDEFPNTAYMVPVDFVNETIDDTIQLRCSKAELEKMKPFIKTAVIEERVLDRSYGYQGGMDRMGYYSLPYITSESSVNKSVEKEQIPPGELAVRRGTRVEAMDGFVGHVDEFLVNRENGHITHMVMREGHLWGQKDVIIPLSAMGKTHEDTVFLNLDKQQIESLPTFPVQRRWS